MKKIIFICLLILVNINLFPGWERFYGGSNVDIGRSVRPTSDNGYIIIGYTSSFGDQVYYIETDKNIDSLYRENLYILKIDSNGDTLWTRTYGKVNHIFKGISIEQTSNSEYILTCKDNEHYNPFTQTLLIKINSNGDTLWTRTLDCCQYISERSVQQTTDGGYIISGMLLWDYYPPLISYVFQLIKTDSLGYIEWQNDYLSMYLYQHITSVQQTTDNGFIMSGESFLVKTDSIGDTLWTRNYGVNHEFSSVQQTSDGGYIIGGWIDNGVNLNDVLLIKTKNNGDTLWTKSYGGSLNDYGYSVQQVDDGGYIIAGYTESFGAKASDVYLIKTNNIGDSVWARTFGGSSDDRAYSVKQTVDGGYIITGYTESYGAGESDIYLIKTDSFGVPVEEIVSSNPEYFFCQIIQLDNKSIQLLFSLPQMDNISVNIYDIAGRYLLTPVKGIYPAGVHQVNFNIENSGVYFYQLKTEHSTETGKFMVLK